MKCMICKNTCEDKLTLVDANLMDKKGNVIRWKLCEICFNLWANQEYDKLSKRIKNEYL